MSGRLIVMFVTGLAFFSYSYVSRFGDLETSFLTYKEVVPNTVIQPDVVLKPISSTPTSSLRISPAPTTSLLSISAEKLIQITSDISFSQSQMDELNTDLACMVSPNGSWVRREDSYSLPAWDVNTDPNCPPIPKSLIRAQSDRPALYYTWKSKCTHAMQVFSQERFCKALQGRSIYALGDSLTWAFYINLRFLFGKPLATRGAQDETFLPCALGNVRLAFIYTRNLAEVAQQKKHKFDSRSIFLLNMGARFRPTYLLLPRIVPFLKIMKPLYPDSLFVWRTTAIGHDLGIYEKVFNTPKPFLHVLPLATPFELDLKTIEEREPRYFNYTFYWHMFAEQTEEVRQKLRADFPFVIFLDVFHVDRLRIDHRGDGLHSCVPGPVTEWSVLLMNLLLHIYRAAGIRVELPPVKIINAPEVAAELGAAPRVKITSNLSLSQAQLDEFRTDLACLVSPHGGSWVPHQDDFVLPGWDSNTHKKCPLLPPGLTRAQSDRKALYYTWQAPSRCNYSMQVFSPGLFCEAIAGRSIYIIGGSLSWSFYINLRYLFGIPLESAGTTRDELFLPCASGKVILRYVMTRNLAEVALQMKHVFDPYSLFILNMGARFRPTPQIYQRLLPFLQTLRPLYPDSLFIWRTTAIGHDLGYYEQVFNTSRPFVHLLPLTTPFELNLSSIDRREPFYFKGTYMWHEFAKQTEEIKSRLFSDFPYVLFLDVYHVDRLRIDHRGDGLHSCVPGPVTEWASLLMNLLLRFRRAVGK